MNRPHSAEDAFAESSGIDLVLARPWWFEQARCRGFGTESFVPAESATDIERAKAVCSRCEVRRACLSYALDEPELVGVWGGTTERERRAIRRAGKRAS